jgi:hypothetical protein
MIKGRDPRRTGAMLAALLAAVAAQAQDVHKCTVNGAVTYQSTPCPAGDVVLPTAPTPSDQETRQARADQNRLRFEAATGRIYRRTTQNPPAPAKPLNNCEKLNRDSADAVDRRDQLRAPSELASHAEMLQKAESEVARLQQLATAGNCRLTH